MREVAARPFGVGIDVADPARMADFWQGLTSYQRSEGTPHHVYLVHPERASAGIYLHKVAETRPPGKNRLHLELWVDDLQAACAKVTALGDASSPTTPVAPRTSPTWRSRSSRTPRETCSA